MSGQNLDLDACLDIKLFPVSSALLTVSLFAEAFLGTDILKDSIQKVLLASTKFIMNSVGTMKFNSYWELLFKVFF